MRHRKAGVKLNRTTSHRQAMFRNMVTSLLKHERIRTTDVKAKELRRWADKIITLAKRGDLHARRQVLAIVREKDVAHKLFAEAQERFGNINGGYTRIVKIGVRAGDAAPISLVELISLTEKTPKGKKKAKGEDKKKAELPKPAVAAPAATAPAASAVTDPAPSAETVSSPEPQATASEDAPAPDEAAVAEVPAEMDSEEPKKE